MKKFKFLYSLCGMSDSMFLTTVLHLSAFRLLASVVPWVYRAYHKHGFSYSYFPIALNAWKEAVLKELPANLAAEILPVYEWMLEQHDNVLDIVEKLPNSSRKGIQSETEDFLGTLLSQNFGKAVNLGEERFKKESGPELFYRDTVRPAMYEIGDRWERGEITVAEEHLATAVAQIVVSTLQGKTLPEKTNRGHAVVAASVGELHDLGARMISHCLEADGWKITFLGANMPLSDLTNFVRKSKPQFVGLSVAMPYHLHHVKRVLDTFKSDSELKQIPILIGGNVFTMFPEASAVLEGATIANEIGDALVQARRWGIA